MAGFKIEAGDFMSGEKGWLGPDNVLMLPTERGKWGVPKYDKVPVAALETVEKATEESVKRLAGTLGWGFAGAFLLGPVGMLAGALAGGNKRRITFIAVLADGRKFMATGKPKAFVKMQAAAF